MCQGLPPRDAGTSAVLVNTARQGRRLVGLSQLQDGRHGQAILLRQAVAA